MGAINSILKTFTQAASLSATKKTASAAVNLSAKEFESAASKMSADSLQLGVMFFSGAKARNAALRLASTRPEVAAEVIKKANAYGYKAARSHLAKP